MHSATSGTSGISGGCGSVATPARASDFFVSGGNGGQWCGGVGFFVSGGNGGQWCGGGGEEVFDEA
jgi:hypothetical protein